ncbi:fatty acid synthase alpha subunit Lsd1, partial [Coemansia sp. RSA 1821]
PVKDILDNIYQGQIAALLAKYYHGDQSEVPEVEYLGNEQTLVKMPPFIQTEGDKFILPSRKSQLPEPTQWLETLAGNCGWLRALLLTPIVVQNRRYASNVVQRVLRPRVSQQVQRTAQGLQITDASGAVAVDISIQDQLIQFNMYSAPRGQVCTLNLQFKYQPTMAFAPIHEVMEGRNERIKKFYAQVWFEKSEEAIDIISHPAGCLEYHGSEMVASSEDVEQFCRAIGNLSSFYISDCSNKSRVAPMDYAMRVFWPALCKCLMSPVCDGDLTKLVHVSNSFHMCPNAQAVVVGERLSSCAKITEIVDGSAGRSVRVQGHVLRGPEQVVAINTSFLFRGHSPDYSCNFKHVDEPVMELEIADWTMLAILQGKEWFVMHPQMSNALCVGAILRFQLHSQYRYKSEKVFAHVATFGQVQARSKVLNSWTVIADVDFEGTNMFDSLVLRYLRANAREVDTERLLPGDGRVITGSAQDYTARAPTSNAHYSSASGDHNPIHTSAYFADLVQLPDTITHGMWTSAAARRTLERVAANGDPARIYEYQAQFVDMIVPGTQLETRLHHTGWAGGRMTVHIEAFADSVRVLEGRAKVAMPRTALAFTGQGAQHLNMGMALYKESATARRIWDAADIFMRDTYGISLLHIVQSNPKQLKVHFVGERGEQIRRVYQNMQCEYRVDGQLVSQPLFPDITDSTVSYTFSAPNGLLFATQFTQPAMLVNAVAEFAHLHDLNVVPADAVLAGHSLGEFAVLCAGVQLFEPEAAVEIGFGRGLLMQQSVRRDSYGRSTYAMLAVNPTHVASWFTFKDLTVSISAILQYCNYNGLLETVNHNVRDKQYVVAGDRLLLEALSFMLSLLSQHTEMPRTKIAQMVHKAIEHALKRQSQDQFFELERTQATTPIPGIDVPFHSSLLREGTWSFRKLLQRIIKPEQVSVDQLRRYIPNLTARPFAVDKEYIQNVFELTGSTILEELLQTLTTAQMQDQKKVAHTLLIEVLSYQFASPVRWIETQDVMLHELGIKRFIEIGPANVLSTMFKRTLHQLGFAEQSPSLSVLCSASDMDAITLQSIAENDNANRPDTTAAEVPASIKSDTQPSKVTETHQPSAPVQQPPSALVEIADAPISSLEAIRALIAYKLKLELDAVPASVAIKDLVGGKSTLQNEIVGDLQKEFGGDLPDKPEEMPLSELSQNLTSSSDSLGKVSATLISRMLASKMPGGVTRSSIGEHLQSKYGLPPMRQQALLLVALAMEPASRLDSETSAYEWLHKVAQKYAQLAGISYAQAQAAGNAGAEIRQVAVINSDEFNQAQKAQSQLAVRTMHVLAAYLNVNIDTQPPMPPSSVDSSVWLDEYGQEFCDRITPMFAPLKARHYDSFWNWARQDLIKLYYDILDGRVTKIDLSMSSHCLRLMNRVTPSMIAMLNHIVKCAEQGVTPAHALARKYGAILVKQCELGIHSMPSYQFTQQLRAPRVRINSTGEVEYYEVDRHGESMVRDYVQNVCSEAGQLHMGSTSSSLDVMLKKLGLISLPAPCTIQHILPPMVHLRSRDQSDPTKWSYDAEKSLAFADILMDICSNGLALSGRRALVTGCGRGSIGAEVIKGLLEAGVQVIATTSSYSAASTQYFQSLYQTHGSRGSSLTLLPFNQASRQDIESLVDYIYSTKGLDWDLDYVLPFAAIPELGHDITALDSWSELSHRTMLTNVMRLIGAIAVQKQKRRLDMHPTLAVLPLSPNHGAFGYDGHYSESKLGLETMLSRWHAEPTWAKYVSVAGAVIGWTRGTGLMSGNNIVAEYVESTGVRTFSAGEMAFNILGLLHPQAYAMAARSPVWADLAGRFQFYPDLTKSIVNLHQALGKLKDVLKKAAAEAKADFVLAADDNIERVYGLNTISKRANHKYKFPKVKSYEELQHLRQLEGMVNLDRVVVVTGYGEVGPYGHAETRWEMEADGEFSLEGCIELAWIMGLIKHHNGKHKTTNKPYVGWVDAQTGEPVADRLVKKKYEKYILEHTGIRLIEPDMVDGYDPLQKTILRELQIEHDMEPFEATEEEALQFKQRNGDKVRIWEQNSTWYVRLLRGATLLVPKALRFDRLVAAQLPTGWNPERFGIPKNIADQVDPVTCYALVATTEALVRSGITDPYELYRYVHMSEVGSSTGTALGGLRSMKRVFNERFLDKDQPPDVYQETFLSTPPAWINMLLMSASGPIKTTIGACATGIASIDVAVDTIQAGKAKIMLAGGTDALCEESSYEFAQMNATSNTLSEFEQGRTPREMSRPCTTTRNGFMESEGAGIVTLMSAATAIKIGAPIYGIVAMAGTATDKEGRSVPAPGKGVLTSARETGNTSPLLDIEYRRRQLQLRQLQIREWVENERKYLDSSEQLKFIDAEGERQHREALDTWGNDFWKRNPDISPLRGCLAVWGLTVDDIGVASFHGTSTKANDKNESEIVDKQMQHLGRTPGNTIFSVCQKYLTGHPKGPASIWMLNGALQMLRSGIVPGNRNADNIAAELEKCQYIMYPSQSIRTPGLKAGLVKSFGFGQVGAECLLVHPDYLFAVLDKQQLEAYSRLNSQREAQAYRYWHNVLVDAHPFVQVKSSPPYTAEQEEQMYLDPLARP